MNKTKVFAGFMFIILLLFFVIASGEHIVLRTISIGLVGGILLIETILEEEVNE